MHKNKINFSVIIISVILLFLVGTGIASWIITISKPFKPDYSQDGEIISGLDISSVTYDGEAHVPVLKPDAAINFSDEKVFQKYKFYYQVVISEEEKSNWIPIDFTGAYVISGYYEYSDTSVYAGYKTAPVDAGTYNIIYQDTQTNQNTIVENFEIKKADVEIISTPTSLSTRYGEQINIASSNTYAVHSTIPTLKVTGNFVLTDTFLEASGTADSITTKTSIEFIPTGNDANNYNTAIINDVTVSLDPVAYSGSTYYSSVEYATKMVTSTGSTIFVIPGKNPTVYKDFSVSSGVTLSLPYENELVGGQNDNLLINNTGRETYARNDATNYKKSELFFSNDVTLTVNGTLTIGGVLSSGGGNQTAGHTVGNYSQITLKNGSTIICYGTLNCYGYIIGTYDDKISQVTLKSGSQLNIPFIVQEHRGGTVFSSMATGSGGLQTSPFNRFHMNNIESLLSIEHGAKVIGLAALATSKLIGDGIQHNTTTINIIGPSGSTSYMIAMNPNTVIEGKYVHSTQKTELDIFGGFSINSLSISITVVFPVTLSTKDVYLPISWYYDISLNRYKDGSAASCDLTKQKLKFLPGASLTINEGVTVESEQMTFYKDIPVDQTQGLAYPTEYKNGTTIPAACLVLNGILNIDYIGGRVLTEREGAKLNVSTSNSIETKEFVAAGPVYENHTEYLNAYLYTSSGVSKNLSVIAAGEYESKADSSQKCGWLTNEVDIFFDFNDGSEIENGPSGLPLRDSNGNIIGYTIKASDLPADPTRTNYTFKGWSLNPFDDPNNVISPVGSILFANTVIYAIWQPIEYTIIYDIDNLYDGVTYNNEYSVIDFDTNVESGYPESYNVEGRYPIPKPTFGELVFDGWYTSSDFNENNKIVEITPGMFNGGQITLYALWNPKGTSVYNIEFELLTESGDIVQEYIKNELGLHDATQSCFSEDGVSFSLTNYISNLVKLNNSNSSQYYYSIIYLVNPDGSTSGISGTSIVINKTNTTNNVLKLRVTQYEKVKVNYEYEGREEEDYFYAVPNNATNVYSETVTQYSLKSLTTGSNETLWFTENTPTGSTYYRASNSKASFDKDTTLYGFKYVPITLKLSQGTGSTLSVSKVENTIVFDTSFNQVNIEIETKSYYFAVDSKITFAANVTDSSKYEKPNVNGTNPITINESTTEYTVSSSASEKGCFSAQTIINTNNGNKLIGDVTSDDLILSFNHLTGQYEYVRIAALIHHGDGVFKIIQYKFDDGSSIELIGRHGLFNLTLNEYSHIDENNCYDYLGHYFVKHENGFNVPVKLVDVEIYEKVTGSYTLITSENLNSVANNLLNVSSGMFGLYNIFEYDENQMFDKELYEQDILKYGLYDYSVFEPYVEEKVFIDFGGKYFAVSIGKGYMEFDTVLGYIRWLNEMIKNGEAVTSKE